MASEKRVAIAGVTGFLGRGLPLLFAREGFSVAGISRKGVGGVPGVDVWLKAEEPDLSGCHAVINLAGEPVNRRWTAEAKKRFHESRAGFTGKLVEAIRRLPEGERPEVLVNASAVGYYGDRGDDFLTETAGPGEGYLAELCGDWEAAAFAARDAGVRVAVARIGVVLGKGGAAFEQLRSVFRSGVGGRLGDGKQWMPWIHADDLRASLVHAVVSPTLEGAFNATAPAPERNADFTRRFAAAVRRPAIFPVPAFALRLMLGEFSQALLASQRAVPSALVSDGFGFRFGKFADALENLLERS